MLQLQKATQKALHQPLTVSVHLPSPLRPWAQAAPGLIAARVLQPSHLLLALPGALRPPLLESAKLLSKMLWKPSLTTQGYRFPSVPWPCLSPGARWCGPSNLPASLTKLHEGQDLTTILFRRGFAWHLIYAQFGSTQTRHGPEQL